MAAHGKIFISGGWSRASDWPWPMTTLTSCEVLDETTNEWQIIASLRRPCIFGGIMCIDNKVYVVDEEHYIECYDPDKDEWNDITTMPAVYDVSGSALGRSYSCSVRVFTADMSRWIHPTTLPK